ncbi:MAG TPA: nucleotidyltransferase family protein, partial [Gemmataceae bacterium]|nr:nucleotidyltransferase family protein [Gemmataceae bacterium]
MIAAVVPAAGRGSRMGRPKLALPVGGRPMLERVIAALREGGADPVVVVTGPHDPALPAIARAAEAEVCELAIATPDMRTTVEHGLRWLEERYHPRPEDAFLLTPGDLPFLDAATVRAVCEAYAAGSGATIVFPTHGGRRGHPVLIAWRHVEAIRGLPPGVGIDSYLRDSRDAMREVAAPGESIRVNVNSPADLLSAFSAEEIIR